ncbi:hypothetical protein CLOLEP_03598 [[Clostridium] leptum DSM 753]|uniref:Uncharacterized protein n=1 Tax=[Clostridium] leptum DSM 753 TaxID=428125 RepID=A7VYC0_9FIRM|nr:hypothetical protein CLOLEP_03598 [[Clostridium] leptum DSM 753]
MPAPFAWAVKALFFLPFSRQLRQAVEPLSSAAEKEEP